MTSKGDDSKFVKLCDLDQHMNSRVNVYGVIISHSRPKPTSQGASNKYSASYTIIDETIATPNQAIVLNMFGNSESSFPSIAVIGNILQCYRCKVQTFRNNVQLTAYPEGGQWLVYYEKINPQTGLYASLTSDAEVQESTSSSSGAPNRMSAQQTIHIDNTWKFTISNKALRTASSDVDDSFSEKLNALHNWALGFIFKYSLMDTLTPQIQLSLLEESFRAHWELHRGGRTANDLAAHAMERADFVCMFLDLIEIPKESASDSNAYMLVWDGSTSGELALPNILPQARKSAVYQAIQSSVAAAMTIAEASIDAEQVRASLTMISPTVLAAYRASVSPSSSSSSAAVVHSSSSSSSLSVPIRVGVPCVVKILPNLVHHLQSITSGTWIRVRNCHVEPPAFDLASYFSFVAPSAALSMTDVCPMVGFVASDTHVVPIPPYSRDVINLIGNVKIATAPKKSAPNEPFAPVQQRRLLPPVTYIGDDGFEYTSLVVSLCCPIPSMHRVQFRIVGYWPSDITRFVVDDPRHKKSYPSAFYWNGEPTVPEPTNKKRSQPTVARNKKKQKSSSSDSTESEQSEAKIYMFALRVTDGFLTTDVIAFDKDAETLLGGILAAEFHANPACRDEVARHLQVFIESGRTVKAFIRKYSVRKEGLDSCPQRRMAVFDTVLFERSSATPSVDQDAAVSYIIS